MRLMMLRAGAAALMLVVGLPLAAQSDAVPGVLVTAVDPGGPAAAAGLQSGDLIVHVDGEPVALISDLPRALADAEQSEVTLNHQAWRRDARQGGGDRLRVGAPPSRADGVQRVSAARAPRYGQGADRQAPPASEYHFEERTAPAAVVLEVVPDSPLRGWPATVVT